MTTVKVLVSLVVLGSIPRQSSALVSDNMCTMNSDCVTNASIPNSECVGSNCECVSGYKDDGMDMCTAKVFGDPCPGGNAECSAVTNGQCSGGGNCECINGYKQTNPTSCTKVLGNSCSMTSDCTTEVPNSQCNTNCECVSGYKEASDLCSKVLGNSCGSPADCSSEVSNSTCNTNCECESGFTEVNNVCSEDSGWMIRSTKAVFAAPLIAIVIQYFF